MDHQQETVFVYKKSSVKKEDSQNAGVELPPDYYRALNTCELTYRDLLESHTKSNLQRLSDFVKGCSGPELFTIIMEQADPKVYVDKIRRHEPDWRVISIHSKECPNFKSTVKLIVNRFIASQEAVLGTDRRLTYDFGVLKQYSLENDILFVVLEDTEGFSPQVLRELITYMQAYKELKLFLVLNIRFPLALAEHNLTHAHISNMLTHSMVGRPSTVDFVERLHENISDIELSEELILHLSGLSLAECFSQAKYALLAYYAGGNNSKIVTHFCLPHAFDPNYRPLIEQALADASLHANAERMAVPASVLYQLARESSIYINIYDLYCAFREMVKPFGPDWNRQSMAFFLEAVTELKLVGVLRDCKRKFECLEKAAWKGV